MFEKCSRKRVLQADRNGIKTLPVFAWQLDNTRTISQEELRILVRWIRPEPANFKFMAMESRYDKKTMRDKILEILNNRGKFHNPFTDTGGSLFGIIDEIGSRLSNTDHFRAGDEVVVMLSTTMIPLYLERIIDINFELGFIQAEGYCIIDSCDILLKKPEDIGILPLLSAMEESGSLYRIFQLSKDKKSFFIIASNPIISYLYAFSIRKSVGENGKLIGMICNSYLDNSYESVMNTVYDKIFYHNSKDSLDWSKPTIKDNEGTFDLTINCAEGTQTEALNLFLTKENGTIFLSNIAKHYSTVALLSESFRKDVDVLCGVGYIKGFQDYNLELLHDCEKEIEEIISIWERDKNSKTKIQKCAVPVLKAASKMVIYDFIYESSAMEKLTEEIAKAAKYDSPVLIKGETGTGKEKIMDLIYANSSRMSGPCVKVNCASVPAALLESEFFGYEKGAFTGACANGKAGYFEMADKGILFLDEIGDLPIELQAKFLRVLQDKHYFRIGGQHSIHTDFRIIAASNKNLKELVAQGLFREDLYYRIAVLILDIPPLRERKSDIIPLARYFLNKYNKAYHCQISVGDADLRLLLEYSWPGNIRELENLIQRIIVNSDETYITADTIIRELNRDNSCSEKQFNGVNGEMFRNYMNQQEKELIKAVLKEYKTTRNAAAALNMTQSQLMRKKKKHNL